MHQCMENSDGLIGPVSPAEQRADAGDRRAPAPQPSLRANAGSRSGTVRVTRRLSRNEEGERDLEAYKCTLDGPGAQQARRCPVHSNHVRVRSIQPATLQHAANDLRADPLLAVTIHSEQGPLDVPDSRPGA